MSDFEVDFLALGLALLILLLGARNSCDDRDGQKRGTGK
jgi:hypothetical protein